VQNILAEVLLYIFLTETVDRNYWFLWQTQLEALRGDISRLTEERNCLLADLSLLQKTCAGCRQCATQSADCRLSVVRSSVLCH